jgi:hypothetical protein
MVAKVNRETLKLDVVGTGPAVQTAKFLLATQLEYIDKQIEIEMNEREARDKLNAVRKQVLHAWYRSFLSFTFTLHLVWIKSSTMEK